MNRNNSIFFKFDLKSSQLLSRCSQSKITVKKNPSLRDKHNLAFIIPHNDYIIITYIYIYYTLSIICLQAHLNECPLALVPCPNKCGNVLLRRDLEEHVNNICDQRRVQCPDCGDCIFAVEFEVSRGILCCAFLIYVLYLVSLISLNH